MQKEQLLHGCEAVHAQVQTRNGIQLTLVQRATMFSQSSFKTRRLRCTAEEMKFVVQHSLCQISMQLSGTCKQMKEAWRIMDLLYLSC